MNKMEFLALLLTKGYNAINDNGAVMVVVAEEDLTRVHSEVFRLAKEHDYLASWGVRLVRDES